MTHDIRKLENEYYITCLESGKWTGNDDFQRIESKTLQIIISHPICVQWEKVCAMGKLIIENRGYRIERAKTKKESIL
jgi:hypothetical protein